MYQMQVAEHCQAFQPSGLNRNDIALHINITDVQKMETLMHQFTMRANIINCIVTEQLVAE
jgi:type II secretory pathway component PulC